MQNTIPSTFGVYRVVRLLGRGGMGEVYEVEHPQLGVHYALKAFAREAADADALRARFLAEGRLLARLDHPRLVRVHDLAVDAATGRPYFVMDLVLGAEGRPESLEDARRAGTVTEERAAVWLADLCDALAYIHAAGVVHRDVKLENVLVDRDGHAVLSDFGVSRIFNRDLRAAAGLATQTFTDAAGAVRPVMGTLGYLPPEVKAGGEATAAGDLYALGVLMFRLLTGIWYEPGMDVVQVLDTYDPLWAKIVPKLLADRVQARSCPSWRELDEKRRMEEAVAAENALRAAKRAKRHAVRYAFGALAVALAMGVLAAATALMLRRARSRLSIPALSDVCFVSENAPKTERAGTPSHAQQISALGDAMFLLHETFDNLRNGRITMDAATAEVYALAAAAEGNDADALFERYYEDYSPNYDDTAETNPLVYLLRQTAKRMETFSRK